MHRSKGERMSEGVYPMSFHRNERNEDNLASITWAIGGKSRHVASIGYDVNQSMWSKSVDSYCQMQPQGQVLSAEDADNRFSEVPHSKFMALMPPYFLDLACLCSLIHGLHHRLHDFMMYCSFGLPLILFSDLKIWLQSFCDCIYFMVELSQYNEQHQISHRLYWQAYLIKIVLERMLWLSNCGSDSISSDMVIWAQQHGCRSRVIRKSINPHWSKHDVEIWGHRALLSCHVIICLLSIFLCHCYF